MLREKIISLELSNPSQEAFEQQEQLEEIISEAMAGSSDAESEPSSSTTVETPTTESLHTNHEDKSEQSLHAAVVGISGRDEPEEEEEEEEEEALPSNCNSNGTATANGKKKRRKRSKKSRH